MVKASHKGHKKTNKSNQQSTQFLCKNDEQWTIQMPTEKENRETPKYILRDRKPCKEHKHKNIIPNYWLPKKNTEPNRTGTTVNEENERLSEMNSYCSI